MAKRSPLIPELMKHVSSRTARATQRNTKHPNTSKSSWAEARTLTPALPPGLCHNLEQLEQGRTGRSLAEHPSLHTARASWSFQRWGWLRKAPILHLKFTVNCSVETAHHSCANCLIPACIKALSACTAPMSTVYHLECRPAKAGYPSSGKEPS